VNSTELLAVRGHRAVCFPIVIFRHQQYKYFKHINCLDEKDTSAMYFRVMKKFILIGFGKEGRLTFA
jgi:hypothetical protein